MKAVLAGEAPPLGPGRGRKALHPRRGRSCALHLRAAVAVLCFLRSTSEQEDTEQAWRLIAKQNSNQCVFDRSSLGTFLVNQQDPTANCYMSVGAQDWGSLRQTDGSLVFKLIWWRVDDMEDELVWSQTSLLTEQRILGFKPLSVDAVIASTDWDQKAEAAFHGLQRSPDSTPCLLDGTGAAKPSSYNCVGAMELVDGGFWASRRRVALRQELLVWEGVLGPESAWRLLVKQDATKCLFNESARESFLAFEDDPSAECHMVLGNQDWDSLRQWNGTFLFRLRWGFADGSWEEMDWAQTSVPTDVATSGYLPLNDAAIEASAFWGALTGVFGGLGKTEPSMPCILDGNGVEDDFWNCIGALEKFRGALPGDSCGLPRSSRLLVLDPSAGDWLVLAKQDIEKCRFEVAAKSTFLQNEDDEEADCYMTIGTQNWTALRGPDGFLTFTIEWGYVYEPVHTVMWRQTSAPTSQVIEGFEPLNAAAVAATFVGPFCKMIAPVNRDYVFAGLGSSEEGHCVFDGNGAFNGSANCVGSMDSPISAGQYQLAQSMLLYVKVPATSSTSQFLFLPDRVPSLVLGLSAAAAVTTTILLLLVVHCYCFRRSSSDAAALEALELRVRSLEASATSYEEKALHAKESEISSRISRTQVRWCSWMAAIHRRRALRLRARAALKVAGGPMNWGMTITQVLDFCQEHSIELTAYCAAHYMGEGFTHICAKHPCPHHHGSAHHRPWRPEDQEKAFSPLVPNMHVLVSLVIRPKSQAHQGIFGYAPLLNREKPLKAELFISHCWNAPFQDLAAALETRPPDTVVWICSFALPQNLNIDSLLNVPVKRSPFAQALLAADGVMLALDSNAEALSRSWCCYELHLAFMNHKPVDIRGPASSTECYQALLRKAESIDIRSCHASKLTDHMRIMAAIRGGEAAVNLRIRKLLASTAALVASVEGYGHHPFHHRVTCLSV